MWKMWKVANTNGFSHLKMWKKCVISIMTEKDFWDKFNFKHNSRYYYAKKKTEKKNKKKSKEQENYPTQFKIFRKQD